MGRLAGGVAHDFNNLLTVINGFTELQLMQADAGGALRHNMEMILKAGEEAKALCQQLLAFSRKQASQPKAVDLNQAIGEVRELLSRTLGENIEVVVRLNPELGLLMADPHHMQQVLINLVVNARDAMPRGGRLTLATANLELGADAAGQHPGVPPGSYVHLVVADTGTGMSKEVLSRIFEPFFSTKEGGKGSGLGLATVYGIVRQSEGWIRVWSEQGRGTAFHLYFPLIQTPPAIEHTREEAEADISGSETILLVEDQASVVEFVKAALECYGYRILPALDGPAAIALAGTYPERIHLLLTDLVMPGMDGRLLAENLREARPDMRILYMTGYALGLSGSEGLAVTASNCLCKPFKPHVLAARVRAALNASG